MKNSLLKYTLTRCLLFLLVLLAMGTLYAEGPADRVYRHGIIFTADAGNTIAESVAVRDGRIVYVGGDRGVASYVGSATVTVDLKGRFLMPGLIDGHMHPLEAGM